MADTKATDETDASALSPADGFAGVQGGADVYITFALVLGLVYNQLTDDDPALTPDSDDLVPTKSAVKDYVDTAVAEVAGATGLEYTSDSTTTDSDPGAGKIRWNNSTHASATVLYIDNVDAAGTSLATLWGVLGPNTFIRIVQADDSDIWQLWRVSAAVNGTGYYKFTVSLLAQNGGTIANATDVRLEIAPATRAGLTVLAFACSDKSTAITTGTGVGGCINSFDTAFNVVDVVADLGTAQTSGSIFTVDVNEAGTTILSTKLTIDNGETTTKTAATPRVISDASIAAGARITADVDQVGDGTAKWLTVYVIGYPS